MSGERGVSEEYVLSQSSLRGRHSNRGHSEGGRGEAAVATTMDSSTSDDAASVTTKMVQSGVSGSLQYLNPDYMPPSVRATLYFSFAFYFHGCFNYCSVMWVTAAISNYTVGLC